MLKKYLVVWKMTASNALQEAFVNRWTNVLFILGKSLRFFFSLLFLFLIKQNIQQFGDYTTDELIVFFLTYQIVDNFSQVLYRGVYVFSHYVRSGEFDFFLSKPISPLFRALTGKPDINDTLFLVPTLLVSLIVLSQLHIELTLTSVFMYLLLLLNSFLIVTALHIFVLVIGILTTEVDGVVWMYRDLMNLGRFPISIYLEPMRFALFFIVPIGIALTIPAQILLNRDPSYPVIVSTLFGAGFTLLSFWAWRWGLKRYSSAGS